MPPPSAERKALSEGLQSLNENMVTMAELSELAIRTAVGTLGIRGVETASPASAKPADVFTLDQEIYGLKQKVEVDCVNLIALHAPVARDLRTITSSLEVTAHLDRIGRYAKDIAESSERIRAETGGTDESERFPKIARMVDLTIQMVDTAVQSFVHRDAEPVRHIIQDDDAVDALHSEVFQEVVDRMSDRTVSPQVGAQFILINRYLERIADHAVNIGEQVVYMLTGERPPRLPPAPPRLR